MVTPHAIGYADLGSAIRRPHHDAAAWQSSMPRRF